MRSWQLGSVYILALSISFATAQNCNPTISGANVCTPNIGGPEHYFVDFTKQKELPSDWTVSDYANFRFGAHGAEFTFSKRKDSAQIWTNFYIFFGKVDVVLQVSPGIAMISNVVLMSDDHDEIDWEWSGNNFGNANSQGQVQTNYFGKGVTGWYDRGTTVEIQQPQSRFYTYSIDWNPDRIVWSIDGRPIRTFNSYEADNDAHQYPQTPSKLQLGIWCGGDQDSDPGVRAWAGGLTDLTKVPYTMYVQSVSIQNYNPAAAYNWTDKSGSHKSIQKLQDYKPPTKSSTGSPSVTSSQNICQQLKHGKRSTTAAPTWTVEGTTSTCFTWHVVLPGESCSSLQEKYGISNVEFRSWNPDLNENCYNILTGIAYCVCGDANSKPPSTSISKDTPKSSRQVETTSTMSLSKSVPINPSSSSSFSRSISSSASRAESPSITSSAKTSSSLSSARELTSSAPTSKLASRPLSSILSSSSTNNLKSSFNSEILDVLPLSSNTVSSVFSSGFFSMSSSSKTMPTTSSRSEISTTTSEKSTAKLPSKSSEDHTTSLDSVTASSSSLSMHSSNSGSSATSSSSSSIETRKLTSSTSKEDTTTVARSSTAQTSGILATISNVLSTISDYLISRASATSTRSLMTAHPSSPSSLVDRITSTITNTVTSTTAIPKTSPLTASIATPRSRTGLLASAGSYLASLKSKLASSASSLAGSTVVSTVSTQGSYSTSTTKPLTSIAFAGGEDGQENEQDELHEHTVPKTSVTGAESSSFVAPFTTSSTIVTSNQASQSTSCPASKSSAVSRTSESNTKIPQTTKAPTSLQDLQRTFAYYIELVRQWYKALKHRHRNA